MIKKLPTFTLVRRLDLDADQPVAARKATARKKSIKVLVADMLRTSKPDRETSSVDFHLDDLGEEAICQSLSSPDLVAARKTTARKKSIKILDTGMLRTSKPGRETSSVDFHLDDLGAEAIRQSLSSPDLVTVFDKLDPNFKRALVSSFVSAPWEVKKGSGNFATLVSDSVTSITKELARDEKVLRVGVLDMGSWIGELPTLLDRLNAAQPLFTIFEVFAPIPGGLVKTPDGIAEWAAAHLKRPLKKSERAGLAPHMIANDFFAAAEDIRTSMGLHFIVGLTPELVADVSPDGIYCNLFSSVSEKTILLSTADLRQFAEQAERPFEAAVGAILVAALMIAINDKLAYHEDSGCMFDFNAKRASLVETIKAMQIEERCLEKMTPAQKATAVAMTAALRRMKRRSK